MSKTAATTRTATFSGGAGFAIGRLRLRAAGDERGQAIDIVAVAGGLLLRTIGALFARLLLVAGIGLVDLGLRSEARLGAEV